MNRGVRGFTEALERQRIAINDSALPAPLAEKLAPVHLRFDRVALRFVADRQAALSVSVPNGKALLFAITAPVRLASKTGGELDEGLRRSLARRTGWRDLDETINENRVRARLVGGVSRVTPVIGFVHNPDCDPKVLFEAAQSLLRRI